MNKILIFYLSFFVLILAFFATRFIKSTTEPAQDIVHIPDPNFKAYLLKNEQINKNRDNEIQRSEALEATFSIDCGYKGIQDLTGIEEFVNITFLSCNGNALKKLNLTNNTKLTLLSCTHNQIEELDLSKNIHLNHLSCGRNHLKEVNTSHLKDLASLYVEENLISNLDLSKNTNLTTLNCSNNYMRELNLEQNTKLMALHCGENMLQSLNLNNKTALEQLNCSKNTLTSIDISRNPNLVQVFLNYNYLHSLNVANRNNLNLELNIYDNPFLSCITVDDPVFSEQNWRKKDNFVLDQKFYFSSNCNTN